MSIQTYSFDRCFSSSDVNIADFALDAQALRTELAALSEDRDREIARARSEGFEAGLTQARQDRDEAILAAIDALQAGIEIEQDDRERTLHTITQQAAELGLAAAELLAGRAIEADPGQAIDLAIGKILLEITRGSEITVRVHPDLSDEVELRIAARQNEDRRKLNLHVVGDAKIEHGDAALEWDCGAMNLDAAARKAAIEAEMEQMREP